jgi:hypothetical protein
MFSEKTNKFPVKVIGYFIDEISGCFTVMVAMVRIRFWLNDADIKVGLTMSNDGVVPLVRIRVFQIYVDPVGLTL